jgi:aminoglycoside phosphotransferase family enzyme/predicted kinase
VAQGLPEALRGLLDPRAYPHPVHSLKLVQTHVSWVLLTGEIAYKIKRPVRFAFLDMSSLEHRAFLCQEEVRLNRRFAPELYLGTSTVTLRADGKAELDGAGTLIEHAVKMRQFAREEELDHLVTSGSIDCGELERFGGDLARIHAGLPAAEPRDPWGSPRATREIILGNLEECAQVAERAGLDRDLRALRLPLEARLDSSEPCMARRRTTGRIRECHGDLHAGNIVRRGTHLTAFDCLEFEPRLRWIDVADEIAFLMADLDARQRPRHAHAFWSGYLTESGDYQACRLLSVFRAHRALVRAKIAIARALEAAPAGPGALVETAAYLDCAQHALVPGRPVLILMHGVSGTGKTWLARRLASALQVAHLRSDIERKRLEGAAESERSTSGIGEGRYSPGSTGRVYRHLAECATDVLSGGYGTIVDATFLRRSDRQCLASIGRSLGVRVVLIDCRAPAAMLESRITERLKTGGDASEADLGVMHWQRTQAEPLSSDEPYEVIEAETHLAGAEDRVLAALADRLRQI